MTASNNDNAMTRFLFAILKQKNLKDINWEEVAHDPVLGEGKRITNGHAARMRYSRFRTSMLGLEPTRRNRTGQSKSRVTKSKKEPRARKEESIKSETAPGSPELHDSIETPPPRIKQEGSPYPSFESRLTPRLTPGPGSMPPPMQTTPGVIQPRLLTPCSDMDMFSPAPTLMSSPGSDMITTHNSFEFRGSPCPDPTRGDPMWPSVPSYPAYSPSYPFDEYGTGPCEHPHMHPHPQVHLGLPSQQIDPNDDWVDVKREASWDDF